MPPIPKKMNVKVQIGSGEYEMVEGTIIEDCGGVIVIHNSLDDEYRKYQLTHTLTGCGLLNEKCVEDSRKQLKDLARKFWMSLSEKTQKIWKSSDNPQEVQSCVSKNSRVILKRKEYYER